MPTGRFFIEEWPMILISTDRVYWCDFLSSGGLRLAVVTNTDLSGVLHGQDISLSRKQSDLLRRFSNLLHNVVFGIDQPPTAFLFNLAFVRGEVVAWDLIESCLDMASTSMLEKASPIPPVPFLVSYSGRIFRVEDRIGESPSAFMLEMNMWGKEHEGREIKTLEQFFRHKYGIVLHPDQCVLEMFMGSPILPAPLSDRECLPAAKNRDGTAVMYLAPQVVVLHPLTKVQDLLSILPRFLLTVERGMIAKKVVKDLMLPSNSEFGRFSLCFGTEFPSSTVSLTTAALTSPAASLGNSYEHLEWLGDAVWRFALAGRGMRLKPEIACRMDLLMSNENMARCVLETYPCLPHEYTVSQIPSLRNPRKCRQRVKQLNVIADIAEALLAVSLLVGGMESVMHTAEKLDLFETRDADFEDSGKLTPRTCQAAMTRLGASLQLFTQENTKKSVGQLNQLREALIRTPILADIEMLLENSL